MQPSDSAETVSAALPLPSVRFFVKIAESPLRGKTPELFALETAAKTVLRVKAVPAAAITEVLNSCLLFIVMFILGSLKASSFDGLNYKIAAPGEQVRHYLSLMRYHFFKRFNINGSPGAST
jgi:hypothetical protein